MWYEKYPSVMASFENWLGPEAKEWEQLREAGKGEKNKISLENSEMSRILPVIWFYPSETQFGLLTTRIIRL